MKESELLLILLSDPDGAVENLIHLLQELETNSQEQCNKLQQQVLATSSICGFFIHISLSSMQMDKILDTKDRVQRETLISQLKEMEKEEKRLCDEISTRRTELVVLRQVPLK